MFWINWAIQGLLGRRKSTLLFLSFLVLVHSIAILSLSLLVGSVSQTDQSVFTLNGIISLSGPETGFEHPEIDKALEIIRSASGGELQGTLLGSTSLYLVNSAGYFDVRAHSLNHANNQSMESMLGPSVAWLAKSPRPFGRGMIAIPAGIAEEMNLNVGDNVSGYKETAGSRVQSIPLQVWGVYIGSDLILGRSVFLSQDDMDSIVGHPGFVSTLIVPLPANVRELRNEVWAVFNALNSEYSGTLPLKSEFLFPHESAVLSVFTYYTGFAAVLLGIFIVSSQIVLGISINNNIFLDFNSRRSEFTTLRTFGLKNGYLYLLIGLQAVFLALASIILATGLVALAESILPLLIEIQDPQLGELISFLGGPRPRMEMNVISVIAYAFWSLLVLVTFSLLGVRHYVRTSVHSVM